MPDIEINSALRREILVEALKRDLFARRHHRGVGSLARRDETKAMLQQLGVPSHEITAQIEAP